MLKLGKKKRAIAMAAATLAIAGGATVGLGGTADAAVGNPPASTTDWFSLYLSNNSGGRYFLVCNEQSAANTVWVAVNDETDIRAGTRVELQDVNSGWTTFGAYINFNPGGCEEFSIINTRFGDALQGYINPGSRAYGTGVVKYN